MRKILLSIFAIASMSLANAQFYIIPNEGIGKNPGGLNKENENLPSALTGWKTILSGASSVPILLPVTLSFPFNFNGRSFTSCKVSNTGMLSFSQLATAPPFASVPLDDASIPDSSICILGITPEGNNQTYASIISKTFGTSPNRQFWLQYGIYNSLNYPQTGGLPQGWVTLSIVLEETTNHIYIVDQSHGVGAAAPSANLSLGIRIDANNVFMVDPSPNWDTKTTNGTASFTKDDNSYYEFVPGTQPLYDLSVTKITLADNLSLTQKPFTISGTIRNVGIATIAANNSFKLNYQIGSDPVQTATVNVGGSGIGQFESYDFTSSIPWSPTAEGTYVVKVYATDINGDKPDGNPNDVSKSVKVWENFTVRKSLHEMFTSETCGPCVAGNQKLGAVLNAEENYTCIKYQQYYPNTGDPYCTMEGVTRANTYYKVGTVGIPYLIIDGDDGGVTINTGPWGTNAQSYSTTLFDNYQGRPSFLEMSNATQTVTGHKIEISASVKPLINMPAGSYKVRMAILERRTENNLNDNIPERNSEKEFLWVMKKMIPDANGLAFTMPAKGESATVNGSFDFPGAYKKPARARNSATADITNIGNYAGIDLTKEHSVEEFSDLVGVIFIQNESTKEVLQSTWTRTDFSGINEDAQLAELGVSIYPNPAITELNIKIENGKNGSIKIFDLAGKEVISQQLSNVSANNTVIDCSNLNKGIYFVQITMDGKTAVKKLLIAR